MWESNTTREQSNESVRIKFPPLQKNTEGAVYYVRMFTICILSLRERKNFSILIDGNSTQSDLLRFD